MNLKMQFVEIRNMIKQSKAKAFKAVNAELIELYWNIGKYISDKVKKSDWGKSIVNNLSDYLKQNEPDMKGISSQNL